MSPDYVDYFTCYLKFHSFPDKFDVIEAVFWPLCIPVTRRYGFFNGFTILEVYEICSSVSICTPALLDIILCRRKMLRGAVLIYGDVDAHLRHYALSCAAEECRHRRLRHATIICRQRNEAAADESRFYRTTHLFYQLK